MVEKFIGLASFFLVLLAYVFSLSWMYVTRNPIASEAGCGWDGHYYCLMFIGEEAIEPFSRRIFPPMLARFFSTDPNTAFLLMNIVSMIIIGIVTTFLVFKNSQNHKYALVASVTLACVISTSRNTFHNFINSPILTDYVGLACAVLFLLGVWLMTNGRRKMARLMGFLLTLPCMVAGTLSREALAVAFTAGLIPLIFWRQTRIYGLMSLLASVLIFYYVIATSNAGSSLEVILFWINSYFSSTISALKFFVMILLSVGVWPFFVYHNLRSVRKFPFKLAVLSFGTSLFAISIFGGGNLDRILLPVGVTFAFLAAINLNSALQVTAFLLAGIGYIVSQYPTYIIQPGFANFLGFTDIWHSATLSEFMNFGIGALLLGLPFTLSAILIMILDKRGFAVEINLKRIKNCP